MPRLPQSQDGALRASLNQTAELLKQACGGLACAISWNRNGTEGAAFSPGADDKWRAVAESALKALSRGIEFAGSRGAPGAPVIENSEIARILSAVPLPPRACAVASAYRAGSTRVRVAIFCTLERRAGEIESLAELGCRAVAAALTEDESRASRRFWRTRGAAAAVSSSNARAGLEEYRREQRAIEAVVAAARALKVRDRFGALGKLLAKCGPFDRWIVAMTRDDRLEVAAASPELTRLAALDGPCALRECFQRQAAIVSPGAFSGPSLEDRIFRQPYLCVPFQSGAVALSSRTPAGEKLSARVTATIARLEPLIAAWRLEAELEAERALARTLARRMFMAAHEERLRIARDLHDDQAQLLAAARIALEGGRDEARAIFKRLEEELRLKLRELRPASLGRSSLKQVLDAELARLTAAGIKARLTGVSLAAKLSRPAQQLCYQVAREALSNVLRHSRATRVGIALGREGGSATISIADNGRGFTAATQRRGSGLSGLKERLELMGGGLRVESNPGSTTLVAKIPENA